MIDFTKFPTERQRAQVVWMNLQSMISKRRPYVNLWDVENRIFLPRRYDLLRQDRPGQQFGAQIYDGHPANAANKFSLGILSYMVSRGVPWMRLIASKRKLMENDDVKQYFQDATTQTLWSFNQGNFYGESVWFTKDATVTGTAYSVAEENLARGTINYKTLHPGECYLEEDQYGEMGIFMRFPVMITAMVALQKFGQSKLPPEIIKDAMASEGGNPFAESKYLLAVYKNTAPMEGSLNPKDKKYKVFWILIGKGPADLKIVEEGGRNTFPLAWRIGKEAGRAYGTSLAADALTEALQVNKLGEKSMEAAHMAVDPPTVQVKELRNRVNLKAGGRTYTDSPNQKVEPVFDQLNWPISDAQMERLHNSLDDKFHIRFLEMLTSRDLPGNITAFQVQQMISEKAILMGSIVEALEDEYLRNAIDIQFDHEEKAGRMPDPPDILFDDLQGSPNVANLEISYEGPLAKMQTTLLKSKPILDGLGLLDAIGKIWPASLLKVNEMKLIEDAGLSVSMDQGLFKRDEEVKEIIEMANAKAAREDELIEGEARAKQIPALTGAVDETSILAQAG